MADRHTSLRRRPPSPAGVGSGEERPLRRDAQANRRQILHAAGQLMAERGLTTPLEDIAAAAGVGIATLYRRFPSREDLVEALFQDRLTAYITDLEMAVSMGDGWRALTWFLERAVSRQIADRALSELLEHGPGEGTIRQLLERIWPLAEVLIDHAKQTGRLRPDFSVGDLALVQHMLVAVGSSMARSGRVPTVARTDAATPELPLGPPDEAWQRYLTIVLDGLVTSRDRPSPLGQSPLTIDQLEELHAADPAARRRTVR